MSETEAAAYAAQGSEDYTAWLDLREGADAAARNTELVDLLRPVLSAPPLIIRDLGAGTGAMGRWLAGRLPGPQRWILHDRDPGLLARAAANPTGPTGSAGPAGPARPPGPASNGGPVRVAVEQGDITGLRAADLVGTSLVTASALLDLLTLADVAGLAAICARAGCPALLTLSVTGQVEFAPADAFDAELTAAFNGHQRRTSAGHRLLGPDAVGVTAAAFERLGGLVYRRPSPWRLGPEQGALIARWLHGWVGAAVEQRPELARSAAAYLRWRLDACAAGRLRVTVGHDDLLVVPGNGRTR